MLSGSEEDSSSITFEDLRTAFNNF